MLGDHICVIAKGRLVCAGTPDFLKKRFGAGYLLYFDLKVQFMQIFENEGITWSQKGIPWRLLSQLD